MSNLYEEWRDVVGFEGCYAVSNLGRVRNVKTGTILRTPPNNLGYCHFGARLIGEKTKTIKVHQAVAKAFIPNPLGHPDINHLDFDKTNNAVTNLEWVSDRENQRHAAANLLYCPHNNPKRRHKLNAEQVRDIRRRLADGATYKSLGRLFKVAPSTIKRIEIGKIWRNVA